MPETARAEVYFIAAMMAIILIICAVAVYFFIKTYRKEMGERAAEVARKRSEAEAKEVSKAGKPE